MKIKHPPTSSNDLIVNIDPWSAVYLSRLDDSDADILNRWYNDPNLRDLILIERFPIQKRTTYEWLGWVRDAKIRVVLGIRDAGTGCLKGIAELHEIDWVNRKCLLGIFLGNEHDRGQGLGGVAASLILDYAFNGLNFERVELTVVAINKNAIALYKKLGFVHEGTKRKACYINGKQLDIEVFGVLRPEWKIEIPADAYRYVGTI